MPRFSLDLATPRLSDALDDPGVVQIGSPTSPTSPNRFAPDFRSLNVDEARRRIAAERWRSVSFLGCVACSSTIDLIVIRMLLQRGYETAS